MNEDIRSMALDKHVDYIKQVAIVIFVTVGAYWSVIMVDEIFLPWAIIIFFSSTVYTLFLPYKSATLITNDWKEIARVKALGMVFLGIPLFIVPAILIMNNQSYSMILPTVHSYVANYQFGNALFTLINVVPPLLIGAVFVSVFMNFLFHELLRFAGYEKGEIQDITRYGTDRSGFLGLGFSLIIIIAVLYLSAGWSHPASSNSYILGTVIMTMILIAYGHLCVRCFPSVLKLIHRRVLELLFITFILLTAFSICHAIICGLAAFLILFYYYYISSKGLEDLGSPEEFMIMNKKKIEEREIRHDIVSFTFYRLHSRASFSVSFFIIVWFLFLFLNYAISFEVLILGFIIPFIVYWSIPRIWLKWIDRKEVSD